MGRTRKFTADQKRQILQEAEAIGSISATAKVYQLSPSQLFLWRKQFQHDSSVPTATCDQTSAIDEYRASLQKICKLEQEQESVANKLLNDLRCGKVSAYNSATAFSALANAFCKIQATKFELFDRLANCPVVDEKIANEQPLDIEKRREERRAAEAITLQIIRMKMAHDKKIKEAAEAASNG